MHFWQSTARAKNLFFIDLDPIAKWSNVLKIMTSYYSQIDYRTAWEGKRMLIPTQPLEIVCLTEGKDILIHT